MISNEFIYTIDDVLLFKINKKFYFKKATHII